MKKKTKIGRNSLIHGAISSLLASLCCITPLVVVLVGFGSLSIALSFLRYRPYFLLLGLAFLTGATYVYINRDYGKCNLYTIKQAKSSIIISVLVMVLVYVGLTYFVIPPILVSQVETKIEKTFPSQISQNITELKVKIKGLTCSCNVADIEYNLRQLKGVVNASVDYNSKTARIEYDSSQISKEMILQSKIFSSTYSTELVG